MSNSHFQFKQFTIHQDRSAMKVTTDACLFGAWVAEKVKNGKSKSENVLDIGAGTGLLSLMLLQKCSDAIVDAIEIDEDSFQQAKENISSSVFADRIRIFHGDAREFSYTRKYDLIISNPPFYENELRSQQEKKNLAHHGDQLTLKELFAVIKSNLAENGSFFLLLPYKRSREVMRLVDSAGLNLSEFISVRQSTKHDFFRLMLSGNLKSSENKNINQGEISIWNDEQEYTEEFVELLKDYYLYL